MVRLACHRVFQPNPDDPLDFEATIEATLLDLHKRFYIKKVLFDPYQMQASAQRLARAGLAIEEFPQSSPNLTAASQNLYELIQNNTLVVYPDPGMRLAISRAVAIETPRGWKSERKNRRTKSTLLLLSPWRAMPPSPARKSPCTTILWSGWSDPAPVDHVARERAAADYQHQRLRAAIFGLSGGQCWPG